MSKIEEIAREYANEYFTNEMLLSGDETWDYFPQILGGLRENAYLCNRDLLT